MTGSGACVFAEFETEAQARALLLALPGNAGIRCEGTGTAPALRFLRLTPTGESPSWLRRRILIPPYEGSNPFLPSHSYITAMNTAMTSHQPLERLMVFAGNANPRFAQKSRKPESLARRAIVGKFSDGEVMVELLENVRGKDVFVLQSTCATNDNLMELLVMVDALKRSSAARVTAAIPYFGYARQDRRPRSARVAISAKVVANMLTSVGVARLLTMDLHADQIQGSSTFRSTTSTLRPCFSATCGSSASEPDRGFPDGRRGARAALAKRLESDLAIIDKRWRKPMSRK